MPFTDVMLVLLIIFMVAAPLATIGVKVDHTLAIYNTRRSVTRACRPKWKSAPVATASSGCSCVRTRRWITIPDKDDERPARCRLPQGRVGRPG